MSNRGGPDPLRFPGPPATELRVVPRSTAQAAYFLSNGVEVPPEHAGAGLVGKPGQSFGRQRKRCGGR